MEFQDAEHNPYESPQNPPSTDSGDPVSTIIPYKNGPALIAYYMGVFSVSACIPLLGIVGMIMAVVAIVMGFKGLKRAAATPEARGRVHAWIGVVGGFLCLILGGIINGSVMFAFISAYLNGDL